MGVIGGTSTYACNIVLLGSQEIKENSWDWSQSG